MPKILISPYQWYSYIARHRIRVLMYHSISNNKNDPLAILPSMFKRQMELLSYHGYRGVSIGNIVEVLHERKKSPRKLIGLTFDDGFQDFLTEALPVLETHDFSATLFIVSGAIGTVSHWSSYNKNRPLLGWNDLQTIVSEGYEIGSHSFSHPDLTSLGISHLTEEIEKSKYTLENQLQVPVRHFAYPGGAFTKREIDVVKKAEYASAVIVGGGWGNGKDTPLHLLHREKMLKTDSLREFFWKVCGFYEVFWLWQKLVGLLNGL